MKVCGSLTSGGHSFNCPCVTQEIKVDLAVRKVLTILGSKTSNTFEARNDVTSTPLFPMIDKGLESCKYCNRMDM